MNQVLMYPLTNYFPFMISLDKSNGNFNAIDDISTKMNIF